MVIGTCEVCVPEAYVVELIDDGWIVSKFRQLWSTLSYMKGIQISILMVTVAVKCSLRFLKSG